MLRWAEEAAGLDRRRAAIGTVAAPRQLVLGAVIVAELVILYALLNGGSWVYDDNLILALAGHSGLTWSWLTSTIFQHWGIGYHFVFSALHALMPIDYRWALVAMLALLGGSMYLIDRICTILFGGRWLGLVAASYLGFSVLFTRQLQWFASGLQALPTTFFDLLCVYGYLRYVRDGGRRWALVSAGALACGLLFYEKPAYMLLYLLLLRLLFMSDDLRPRTLAQNLWRERVVWSELVGVTALWTIGYLHYAGSSAISHGSVSAAQYLRFFRIMWGQTLAPALAGFTLPQTGLSAAQVAAAVGLQVLIVLGVAFSLRRKRSAWRAWVLLAIAFIVNGAVVARARIPVFGPDVAGDLRYLTDFVWLVPLSVCFAFTRRPCVWTQRIDPKAELTMPGLPRPAVALATFALVAYSAFSLATMEQINRNWPGGAARTWQANVRAGLARFASAGRPVVVTDGPTPPFIVESAFRPLNLLSWILPLYTPRAQIDGVIDGPLVLVDAVGGVHRATVSQTIAGGSVPRLLRSHDLSIAGAARVVKQSFDTCVTAGSEPATIIRRAIAAPRTPALLYYLWLTYSARQTTTLPVAVDPGGGFVGWTGLHVARGPGASILFVGSPAPRRVQLGVPAGSTLCLSAVNVVTLRAIS